MTDNPVTIVDSSTWIDYFAGRETLQTVWLKQNVRLVQVGLTDLILIEVLQGYRDEADFREARGILEQLIIFPTCGSDLAMASVANYRRLRKLGLTVRKTIDCVIATYCIKNDFRLLHNDRDFDAFEKHLGLRVIHPQSH